ncbi:MAG: sulfotransferase [Spirulinaceae cyanobacterium]
MTLPNFLIIGVQKAGTTSIYNYLDEHPQIYMSPVKETNFLEADWEKEPEKLAKKSSKSITDIETYHQLFAGVQDEIAIGEASPNYLFHYQTATKAIQRYMPDAKLIAILRNPTERAYSDYLMHIRDAIEEPESLSEIIAHRAESAYFFRKGFYYEQIKYFFDKFGRQQVKVYLYDDLCKNPVKLMQDMYSFIGVDDNFVPDTGKKAQKAQVPKNQGINNLLKTKNPLRNLAASTLKTFLPLETRQKIRDGIINLNSQGKKALPLQPEDRTKLVEMFREDVLKLQDLLGKDLSGWLK